MTIVGLINYKLLITNYPLKSSGMTIVGLSNYKLRITI
jgi:hypothetical protein